MSLSSQFLMVKFLCTRQDSAERLGVQSLSFSGYSCGGTEKLADLDELSSPGEHCKNEAVNGLCLLNKTLFFIQQLTQNMVIRNNTTACFLIMKVYTINLITVFGGKNTCD